jgi:2-dehydro-3-deoxygalactonokinase
LFSQLPSQNRGLLVGAELNGMPLLRQVGTPAPYFIRDWYPKGTQGLSDLRVAIGGRAIELDPGIPKEPRDRLAAEIRGLSQDQGSMVEEQLHRVLPPFGPSCRPVAKENEPGASPLANASNPRARSGDVVACARTMGFVAVDWGSTRFRAYRVEESGVSERLASEQGILATPREGLAAALVTALEPWRAWIERDRVPVRMAGMIGSNAGLRDAGYQRLPIFLDELAATSAEVEVKTPLATRVGIRPGLALVDGEACDVMRGEEVQLLGAVRLRPAELYVFPGSHSKWVPVRRASGRARVHTFSTMMTGELYAWLVEQSLVGRDLPEAVWSDEAFARGVDRARGNSDIIEEIFRTRARWLLGDVAPAAAPSFLSGLLIGHELVAMLRRYDKGGQIRATAPLVVVGAERLCALYAQAAQQLAVETLLLADELATVEGFRSFADAG